MESINIECQVFTPHNIVVEILNQVGYIEKLYGKKVLENSSIIFESSSFDFIVGEGSLF